MIRGNMLNTYMDINFDNVICFAHRIYFAFVFNPHQHCTYRFLVKLKIDIDPIGATP